MILPVSHFGGPDVRPSKQAQSFAAAGNAVAIAHRVANHLTKRRPAALLLDFRWTAR
jgi:hypothetical protein